MFMENFYVFFFTEYPIFTISNRVKYENLYQNAVPQPQLKTFVIITMKTYEKRRFPISICGRRECYANVFVALCKLFPSNH